MAPSHDRSGRGSGGGGGGFSPSWLGGIVVGSPSRRVSAAGSGSVIADDIRKDEDLFFADDGPPPLSLPPSAASAFGTVPSAHHPSGSMLRRPSATSLKNSRGRISSHQKMDELQREVDMALEFFSQETENELDHLDGDDYLKPRDVVGMVGGGNKLKRSDKVTRFGLGGGIGGDDCCDSSFPGTAATSMATSVFTDDSNDCFSDVHTKLLSYSGHVSPTDVTEDEDARAAGTLSLKHKTKSIISFPSSLLPSQTKMNCTMEDAAATFRFEDAMAEELDKMSITDGPGNRVVDFDSNPALRSAMEPFLAVARIRREEARQHVFDTLDRVMMPPEEERDDGRRSSYELSTYQFHIGSTYGVPYPALRNETPFLYDVDSFPLSEILAETMGVKDLSKLHIDNPLIKDKRRLMAPLKHRGKRRRFHQCFDSFVTSHVIPLLHSQALSKGVFYTNRHQLQKGKPQSIVYRYQTFPSINIVRPGECSTDPHCDTAQGHSVGTISYHVPLTAAFGTNALYAESRPGREDWHPLEAGSPGLGFQFDGARCLHFGLRNDTDRTRVSLNFRVAITRAPDRFGGNVEYDPDDQLCCPELLRDEFSRENPGFHEEVVVHVGEVPRSFMPGPVAVKRRGVAMSVVG